ncbi:winged helix-turn-helix domain-containing protein [Streptomyces niveiscabiei]|uniref:Winged helix-turn-helix domain-containing protein n=1 Tax=Streptomyces niveiscabiei TaxID=164115 RepID=A0ABW9HS95_9ACTN
MKSLINRLFRRLHRPGVWRLLRRHGWNCQVPVRGALERGEAAIEARKAVGVPLLAGEYSRG